MIRKAKPEDAVAVAPLIVMAMGALTEKFSNSKNYADGIALFELFFAKPNNQYSFENTLVFEDEYNEILAAINGYDGASLKTLRQPFLDYVLTQNKNFNQNIENETQAGEFYLDTISVNPKAQGKGIGKLLILEAINLAKQKGHNKIGLLVEKNNARAFKLYNNLGFEIENEKTFLGNMYYHLVYTI